jgi:hypothetical protein
VVRGLGAVDSLLHQLMDSEQSDGTDSDHDGALPVTTKWAK